MRLWASKVAFTNWPHAGAMVALSVERLSHDLGALETSATCAGLALACSYSSADEYEAEIIRERRAAGAYAQPNAAPLRVLLAATAAACLAALLLLVS